MSWQPYVDTQLIATGNVSDAFIIGKADASVWASTQYFVPKAYKAKTANEDGTEVEVDVNEAADFIQIAQSVQKKPKTGLRIAGTKFMPLRTFPKGSGDDGIPTIFFKKPKGGGCLCVTNQCIIVGTFDEGKQQTAAGCNFAVEALARYLFSIQY
mmetsp:Transcript_28064/g.34199  ORF Transcript_28064/g.34199 Transcript_28064/m.34199 type:complete len:155 (-) Transcript_28064:207-671(-)|eukprot:CAMPEP_0204828896 /NCGR_PEP_ID=MMETSP1346-20131115/6853_1 /ASSEMBLY_ACC=CAM_ASM_000771 /TAXON_ID=215587 /ORGANISM="Aplanochytrium stocchinoi, Strain GSBS06" /LENGTH=154 /DNA_ID=CAMNT_0051958285 /DNA_START=146 /DNA_END=610 /DNA_ORIENTATION=-